MQYTIRFSTFFYNDLAIVTAYLSQYSTSASSRFQARLRAQIDHIREMPDMYEAYRFAPAYRHVVVDKYVAIYKVDEEKREILLYRLLTARGILNTICICDMGKRLS